MRQSFSNQRAIFGLLLSGAAVLFAWIGGYLFGSAGELVGVLLSVPAAIAAVVYWAAWPAMAQSRYDPPTDFQFLEIADRARSEERRRERPSWYSHQRSMPIMIT